MKSIIDFGQVFDFEDILGEIRTVLSNRWIVHDYSSVSDAWSGLALRSSTGKINDLYSGDSYHNTVELQDMSKLLSYLGTFKCDIARIRLLRLKAKSYIKPHTDNLIFPNHIEHRFQIPLITNQKVRYVFKDVSYSLDIGRLYYLNISHRHSVFNDGDQDRISLVIDLVENEWIKDLFF